MALNAPDTKHRNPWVAPALGAATAVLAIALYWPIRGHEWVSWDDFEYITQNPHIAQGLSADSIWWALSSFHLANWFPLTWLSWMLDFELHGFDAGAFLTTNLLLHAVNSALLFAALFRMTGSAGRSAFVAAVFAVHPLHVESVAWAAARKDVLSGSFWMLAMWLHAGPKRNRVSVAICFALGFAAKPTLVTLPFALLLLDDWPLARTRLDDDRGRWDPARWREILREKLPLFALAATFAALMFLAQRSGGTVQDTEALPIAMRFKNAAFSYLVYLADAVHPRDLAFFYPHPGDAISAGLAAGCAVLLATISTLAVAMARKRPYLCVGWLWYLGTLLPTVGLVQIGAQARADRYMYLPLIGLSLIVAWGIPDLLRHLLHNERARRITLGTLCVIAIGALSWRTSIQIPIWSDSLTLYEHALQVTSRNHVAHAHLGGAYLRLDRIEDAVAQYEAALQISPDYTRVANNLAWLLATSESPTVRNPARALELALLAASLAPDPEPALLDTLAAAYAATGRFADAVETAERALAGAHESGDPLEESLQERLALYRESKPFQESR